MKNNIKKDKVWIKTSDGWFTFYYCGHCGKKHQLAVSKKPLPDHCPYCGYGT